MASALQGFSDERHGDVVLVRPMRDHTLKEVAFYNHLFGVPSVFTPAIDTKVGLRRRTTWAGWGHPLHRVRNPQCIIRASNPYLAASALPPLGLPLRT